MRLNNRSGFSLVELAVVLVICGLILAMGAPPLGRYLAQQKVRDAARQVAGEMKLARQRAVTDGWRYWMIFGTGTNNDRYWWGEQKQNSAGAWLPVVQHGPFLLPNGTKTVSPLFGGTWLFWYRANGTPNASGSVKLVSTNPALTDTVTVNLDLTGGVW